MFFNFYTRFMKKLLFLFSVILLAACEQGPFRWHKNVLCDEKGDTVLSVTAECSEGISSSFHVKKEGDGLSRIVWTFKAEKDIEDASIHADVIIPKKAEWWMMPSISYNGNNWGTGLDPKGAKDGDKGWWTYSFRRSPIPGAIYSEGTDYAVATWSTVPQKETDNFSFSIMPEEGKVTHRLIWPEEEMPRTYSSRDVYSDGWRHASSMKAGECRTVEMLVDVTPTQPNHLSMAHFMQKAWEMADKVKFDIPSNEELWKNGIRFFKESLWDPEGGCIGFRTGLAPDLGGDFGMNNYGDFYDLKPGDKDEWRKMQDYSCAWVGQNISTGCSLLFDYLKNGDKSSLDMGLSSLDCWAENAPAANGLFPAHFFWKQYDGCHMGTASMMFREAYYLAKECGLERELYRKISLGICDAVMNTQREDGCYGRNWNEDGTVASFDGFTSCYMMPAMLEAYQETGDERYLTSVKKAFDFYIGEFRKFGFTTAGALDTNCIDKESSLPFFIAAVRLYEALKEQRYLDDAVALGYYISTWLWHYDGIYPEDDSFTKYGFHTFGGTSISTQHQALDTFGLLPVPEMRKLAELTGDKQWAEKSEAMWRFCCQLISDGTLVMNGRKRPAGGQCEAFFQNSWKLYSNKGRFDNWLVAWPNALRLEFLRKGKI